MKNLLLIFLMLTALFTLILVSCTPTTPTTPVQSPQHTAPAGNRVIRLQLFSNGVWGSDGQNGRAYETPDRVLTMIAELNPNILDRLFNNSIPDLNAPLQYRDQAGQLISWQEAQGAGGFPAGSIGSFLYRAIQGRTYYPRLGMDLYDPANDSSFFATAQALYDNAIALGVAPEKRFLDLDLWEGFARRYLDKVSEVLTKLYAQGWQGIGISKHGSFGSTNNLSDTIAPTFASFVCQIDYATQTVIWHPDSQRLSELKTDKHLKRYFLYIDFPQMMQKFLELSPDEEAYVLRRLVSLQSMMGYTFAYPIAQTFWDMNIRVTQPDGPWTGMTLYQIVRYKLLPMYNPLDMAHNHHAGPTMACTRLVLLAALGASGLCPPLGRQIKRGVIR